MLPSPGLEEVSLGEEEQLQRSSAIAELSKKHNIGDANSPEGRIELLDALSGQLTAKNVTGHRLKKIKNVVGQYGLLDPRLYRVDFAASAEETMRPVGLRRNHVRRAVHEADRSEHLFEDDESSAGDFSLHLQTKVYGDNPVSLIALTRRVGAKQIVQMAVKLRNSKRAVDGSSPSHVLAEFAEKYGVDIQLGDLFGVFSHQSFVLSPGQSPARLLKWSKPKSGEYTLHWFKRLSKDRSEAHVAYAFILDVARYKADFQ